jgi:hypothetical protein
MPAMARVFLFGATTIESGGDGPSIKVHYSAITPIDDVEDNINEARRIVSVIGRRIRGHHLGEMKMPPEDVVVVFARINGDLVSAAIVDTNMAPARADYLKSIPVGLHFACLVREMDAAADDDSAVEIMPAGDKVQMRRVSRDDVAAVRKGYELVPPQ